MYLLIGLIVVIASVAGGYTMSHGDWGVLLQPARIPSTNSAHNRIASAFFIPVLLPAKNIFVYDLPADKPPNNMEKQEGRKWITDKEYWQKD